MGMPSLSSDLCYEILRRLDGESLATAACACAAFCSISKEEKLWEKVCSSMWPSTGRNDVKNLISSIGGFKKFYADCFPLIVNKEVTEFHWNEFLEDRREWTEDRLECVAPSDFVFIVDVRYKEKTVCSKVLWGIPNAASAFDGWFYNCPFRVDLIHEGGDDNDEGEVMLTARDKLPPILSMEKERKDGKLWRDLCNELRLSWIIVNQKIKRAANLTSWSPLGGQRHWPLDRDFTIRFGSILSAKDILLCRVVECMLIMKFKVIDEGVRTTIKLTELSLQLGDMEGARINGRNSLVILKEALSCRRSKNYSKALESCRLFSKLRSELKEEKLRNENMMDRLCIISGIAAFGLLWYYVL